jgi:hypothetical protein
MTNSRVHMLRLTLSAWVPLIAMGLMACGESLERVQGLENCSRANPCPANTAFTLVVRLQCQDPCIELKTDEATCEVDVEVDDRRIDVRPSIPFEDEEQCFGQGCQGGVFVDCAVDPLPAGDYEVRDEFNFRGEVRLVE